MHLSIYLSWSIYLSTYHLSTPSTSKLLASTVIQIHIKKKKKIANFKEKAFTEIVDLSSMQSTGIY